MITNIARSSAPPKKRIALFIDGTWNVEKNNTNVWRLYSLCASRSEDGIQQVSYYTRGVGTAYGSKFKGGVFGVGFNDLIVESYEWLIQHYNDGDDIFIFGFSRGAYAARGIAGFIAKCGILQIGSPVGVGELFARYQKHQNARTIYELHDRSNANTLGETTRLERWMLQYCIRAPIEMVGVWDTVKSLVGAYDYVASGLRIPIRNAFHAMAIDEHRHGFKPTLYTHNIHHDRPSSEQAPDREITTVEQRWFVGAHANVGGGYDSDLLCQRPLLWISKKALALGLTFRGNIEVLEEPYSCAVKNSYWDFAYHLYFLVHLGIRHFREIGKPDWHNGAVETGNVNETIDGSVFERWRRDETYRPKNMRKWQHLYNVDPAQLRTSVYAKAPDINVPD